MAPTSLIVFVILANYLVVQSCASRAFFVFGDSLVDNGNNNFLPTIARVDYPPYGIDYPTHRPTGRFSNGLNIVDALCEELRMEPLLPYLSPEFTGDKLLNGANFASAGAGILNDTGREFVSIISMYQQLEYFGQYQQRLRQVIGPSKTKRLVNEALFLISFGANDLGGNGYVIPYSPKTHRFSLPDYAQYIVSEYHKLLQRVYAMGARKVLVSENGPLGCVPAMLATSPNGDCDEVTQELTHLFNRELIPMIKELNSQMGSDAFVAVDIYSIVMDLISNSKAYGFVTSKVACCGQGPYNGLGLCSPVSPVCSNRNVYLFWDGYHPTQRACKLLAARIMHGSIDVMHPMNMSEILRLGWGIDHE